MKYFLIIFITLAVLAVAAPQLTHAQPASVPDPSETVLADGAIGMVDLMKIIANWMFTILLAVAVIFILLAAYKYLISEGGEEVGNVHRMLIYAAVAIAVAFLSKGIVFVVEELVTDGGGAYGDYDTYGGSRGFDDDDGSIEFRYRDENISGGIRLGL